MDHLAQVPLGLGDGPDTARKTGVQLSVKKSRSHHRNKACFIPAISKEVDK